MAITERMVEEVGERLYASSLTEIPKDVTDKMEEMRDAETSDLARFQLDKILENAEIATSKNRVVCQDTGISSYKVRVGTKAIMEGDIVKALSLGTARASKNLPTIPHSVHPITKENSGDGTGPHNPMIHWEVIPNQEFIEIVGQPVGGGGDLCSAVKMFPSSVPFVEIKKFIVSTVVEAGSKPCPPIIVGVGLGTMFEYVSKLAKDAVMRPLDQRNPEKIIADLEEELLVAINQLGIGPMGMGGSTTCLAVNIEYGNTGTYIMPVAVKIGCWDVHRKTARLYNDGKIEYL